MGEKEVVRVCLTNGGAEYSARLETKTTAGETLAADLPVGEKLLKRMAGRHYQFFYAERRDDGSVKLGAYAPYQEW